MKKTKKKQELIRIDRPNELGFADALAALNSELIWDERDNMGVFMCDGSSQYVDDLSMQFLRFEMARRCRHEVKGEDVPYLLSKDHFYALRDAHMHTHRRDRFVDYLDSLPKVAIENSDVEDYELKVDRMLCDAFSGCDSTKYSRCISRMLTLGAVWRAYEPGCVLHEVPVIKGPQGVGKDTIISSLVPSPRWYSTSFSFARSDKERVEATLGKVFVIASEMGGVTTTRDLESLKSYVTTSADHVRLAYRRDPQLVPRRFVFACTTNLDTPLPHDPTGNRRWCVVEVGPSDVGAIELWMGPRRDALWAEAVALYRMGVSPRLPREMREVQSGVNDSQSRSDEQMDDAYKSAVDAGFLDVSKSYTLTEIAVRLGISVSFSDWRRESREMQHRVRDQLLSRGWVSYKGRRGGGNIERLWKMK